MQAPDLTICLPRGVCHENGTRLAYWQLSHCAASAGSTGQVSTLPLFSSAMCNARDSNPIQLFGRQSCSLNTCNAFAVLCFMESSAPYLNHCRELAPSTCSDSWIRTKARTLTASQATSTSNRNILTYPFSLNPLSSFRLRPSCPSSLRRTF